MFYTELIDFLKTIQTRDIKAISIPDSCAVTQIPNAFFIVMPNIMAILQEHISLLCPLEHVIALFGLQVTAISIQSDLPINSKRICYPQHPHYHFCCALNYLFIPKEEMLAIGCWQDYESLMIDFTSGLIMDNIHYSYLLRHSHKPGIVYGELDKDLLRNAWKSLEEEYHYQPLAQGNINHFLTVEATV